MDLLSQNEILNHINTSNSQVVKSINYHGADEDKALVIKELKFHEFKKIKKQESKLYTKQQILDVIQVLYEIEVYQMLEQINRSNEENSSFANLYRVEDELYNQTGISENELVDAI